MNLTLYGDISPRTAAKASARLLERGQAQLLTERFGYSDPQPMNASKTRKWRRYNSLSPATAPLAEGITPAGQKLTYTDVTANLEQFGDYARITDVIHDTHEDPVLNEASDVIGEQAAETIELIRFSVLTAGTNVYYANAVAARASVASLILIQDVRKIERGLRRNRARTIGSVISPTAKIDTHPVRAAFFAMCHTDLEADIRTLSGFVSTENYADSDGVVPGEFGKVEGTRFCSSVLIEPWQAAGASGTTYLSGGVPVADAAAADVYPVLVVARNAYAIVPLQGKTAVKIAVKNPGTVSDSDPLGQRGFVSWKMWQTAAILTELWMARYECACRAVPT